MLVSVKGKGGQARDWYARIDEGSGTGRRAFKASGSRLRAGSEVGTFKS